MEELYFRKMLDNLKEQLQEYKQLLKFSEQKRSSLVTANMDELNLVVKAEETLIKTIGGLEVQRLEIQENLARTLNIPSEDLYWDNLKTIANPKTKEELEKITLELRKIINQLSEINSVNQKLLDQALKLVQFSVNVMAGETERTYVKPSGQGNLNVPKKEGKIFDIKT